MPSRQSVGVVAPIPRDFIPEPGTSSRVTYAPLVESSRRSCQTTVVLFNTETQRLPRFSSRGSPCLLWLYPRASSQDTHDPLVESSRRSCQTAAVHSNTESQRNRRFFSRGSPCLCGYTLGLLPRTPTLRSWSLPDALVAEGDTPSLDGRNRLSPGGQLPAFARGRAQKKGVNLNEIDS